MAINEKKVHNLILAGGVSANKYLREEFAKLAEKENIKLSIPPIKYCTDNAAMIGCAAYPLYLKKDFSDYTFNAASTLDLF